MAFFKKINTALFILFLASFFFTKTVSGDWEFDADPPTTSFVSATGTGCSTVGSTTTCPSSTTPSVTLSCADTPAPPDGSGCAPSGTYYDSIPTGSSCIASSIPAPGSYSNVNPFDIQASGGSSQDICAFSVDNAGNIENSRILHTINFTFTISGKIYTDFDNNGAFDGSDANNAGRTVELYDAGNNLVDTQTTAGSGATNYSFADVAAGTYTVKLTVPAYYKASTFTGNCSPADCIGAGTVSSNSITLTVADANADFGITPLYTIEGTLYNDVDKSRIKEGGEAAYSASTQEFVLTRISDSQTTTVTTNDGTYSFSNLIVGNYKVEYTKTPVTNELPTGFELTYPQNATFPFYNVAVGSSCSVTGGNRTPPDYCWQATGTPFTGSIHNLDFGISNSITWFQCQGADCRIDDGFDDPVPPTVIGACNGSYASTTAPLSASPGIIYSGDSTPSFCSGGSCPERSSVNQWIVGTADDALAPFSPVNSTVIRSSYSYMTTTLRQSGLTPTTLSTTECGVGGIADCDLSTTTLANGIYLANGDLTLTSATGTYTFPSNKNYVILVNGSLNINTKIIVPIGSTATFSVADNITVDKSIGEAYNTNCDFTTPAHTGCDVEGFYSTDKSFIIYGYGADGCASPPTDNRLNIAGSIIVNAALGGGSLQNQRDLCSNNIYCPVYSIVERPDFILNAPDFLRHPNYIWQEVAP